MNYLPHVSVLSSTSGVLSNPNKTATCAAQNEQTTASFFSSMDEQYAARNPQQYSAPAATLYEALLATAAATASQQVPSCSEEPSAPATQASLEAAVAVTGVPVKASDNHLFPQRPRSEAVVNSYQSVTGDSQPETAFPTGALRNTSWLNTSSASYTVAVHASGSAPLPGTDTPFNAKGERRLSLGADRRTAMADGAAPTSVAAKENVVSTTLQSYGHLSRSLNARQDACGNTASYTKQDTTAVVNESRRGPKMNCICSSQATETLQHMSFTGGPCCEAPATVAPALDPHGWNQVLHVASGQLAVSDGPGSSGPALRVRTATVSQSVKHSASGEAICASRRSSAAGAGCLFSAKQSGCTSSSGGSPTKYATRSGNPGKLVLPGQSRARTSLSAWCWDTGKYSYPDACTPRMWSGMPSASLECGCEPPTDEACYLRSFRCASPPGFVTLPSPTCPESTRCSKVEVACRGLASLCGFTVSPMRSPCVNREDRNFHGTGGSATDWLAVARGRDSAAPFCKLPLEEAAGDGLCNPHHELQSLADVLREDEGPPAFTPSVLLTSEVRGIEAHGGLDFNWHDVATPASDGRSRSASPPDAARCSGTRDHPDSLTAFSESKNLPATPTRPPNPQKDSRKSQIRSPLVSEALIRTLLPSKGGAPVSTGLSTNSTNSSSAPVGSGIDVPKMTGPATTASLLDGSLSLRGPSCVAAVVLPASSVFDVQLPSAHEERTPPDLCTNLSQAAVTQSCQQVDVGARSTTAGHPPPFAAENTDEKAASSSRASLPIGLQPEGSAHAQVSVECSRMCLSTTDTLSQTLSPSDLTTVCSACPLKHPTRECAHTGRSDIAAAPSTVPTRFQNEDVASTWHMLTGGKAYPLATDSSLDCSRPSFKQSCWTQKTEAAGAHTIQREAPARVQDAAEEPAKEGHGGISTDVSTAPSVCGSGSCVTSPLTPPQGSPVTAVARTTSTTPRRGPSAQPSPDARPPSLEQSCFSLPPPNASSLRGQVGVENEAGSCSDGIRNVLDGRSTELDKSTTTATASTCNILSPRKSSLGFDNSTACTNTTIDCSAITTASMLNRKSEKLSPSQLVLMCPAAGHGGLPVAPTELERRPQAKNKLNPLEFSALPTADCPDSPHSEYSALQFPQYGAPVAGSCSSRTASESVPTPTTAGHSSQSPMACSSLSSEGDATTGNASASVGLGVNSTQQQDFSASSTDGSRGTPSSINGCTVSTPATGLQLVDFFSGKETEMNVSESTAHQATCSLSLRDPADSNACHNAEVQQCSIQALSTPAQTGSRTGGVDPTTGRLSLSTDDWVPSAPPAASCNEMLLVARQESADKITSGQTGAAAAAKPAASLVDECAEKVYQVELPPPVLQTPPASLTGSASQAAHCVVPSVDVLDRISQENKAKALKYVLAGSEGDVSQCTQFNGHLLQQQLAASLLSKEVTQTYQQWWFSNCESLQCRQQHNTGHDNQDRSLPCGQPGYSESDLADPSACSGSSYAGTAACKEVVTKYVRKCEARVAAVGKLHLAANVDTNRGYLPSEEELLEYEEQWDGAQCTAFDLGDAGPTAVPVRTRKGFRKPLPLPQEMLACPGEPGDSEKGNEPVLQYDVSSREWRVFWVEDRLARYKVFQAKKFGKERAQQLAEEWYRRARAGNVSGSGRGLRSGVRGQVNPKCKKLKVEL